MKNPFIESESTSVNPTLVTEFAFVPSVGYLHVSILYFLFDPSGYDLLLFMVLIHLFDEIEIVGKRRLVSRMRVVEFYDSNHVAVLF